MLAALVILPAVFSFSIEPTAGPPLMFITMPEVFKQMPGGFIFAILFFVAVLFAGISSLINLYETPVELLQQKFKLKRSTSVFIILAIGFLVGIFIQDAAKLGLWMDVISIYVIPLGALLAGVMFFWVLSKDFALQAVNKGALKPLGEQYYIHGKYVYCGLTLLVYILGIFYGGIG